ncbi:MAG: sodium:proton antiporter [Sphingomicrobium sp.]
MTEISLAPIGILLLIACLIAIVSRSFGLPYIVGLVGAGLLIALYPETPEFPLSRDLIFNVFLPPLVFEAALQLPWKGFRRELPLTLVLAFAGVGVASAAVAAGMHYGLGWSWLGASLFAILISATDPVSVIATFKDIKVEERLRILVESESLLNDGVAAVGFAVLVAIAGGASASIGSVVPAFIWTLGGGVLIGAGISAAALMVGRRTDDHLVEITLTALAAYGSFLIAERFHASGILASLTAGLMVGYFGRAAEKTSGERSPVADAWEFFAFLANSVVFLLIGIQEARVSIDRIGYVTAGVAILLVLLGRALAVYPITNLFRSSQLRVPAASQHVLFWGGLRGALALALALTVPASVPERGPIIISAFIVVAFSIFVQGLTMPLLIKWLKIETNAKPRKKEPIAATNPRD